MTSPPTTSPNVRQRTVLVVVPDTPHPTLFAFYDTATGAQLTGVTRAVLTVDVGAPAEPGTVQLDVTSYVDEHGQPLERDAVPTPDPGTTGDGNPPRFRRDVFVWTVAAFVLQHSAAVGPDPVGGAL